MSARPKTPLQAVVSVICDAICDLPFPDQVRTIEAVCITLGIPRPVGASPQPLVRERVYGELPLPDLVGDVLLERGGRFTRPNGGTIVDVRPLQQLRGSQLRLAPPAPAPAPARTNAFIFRLR